VARNDYIGRVIEMRYFSYITLATVGYGDIVPRSTGARTMALLEAILGQFYLVALIGRLVGLHIVHGSDRRE
jgi:voltage-gated potassium channel Kch